MKWIWMVLAGTVLGCSAPSGESMPVHDSLLPRNGTVTEYWPNGSVRRERVYRDGQVISAVERYRNGQVAYEVEADSSQPQRTATRVLPYVPE